MMIFPGIAETYLMKAIGQCTGRTLAQVRSAAHKCGDLGQVAEQARATQRTMFAPPPLTLRKVFAALKEIANMTGEYVTVSVLFDRRIQVEAVCTDFSIAFDKVNCQLLLQQLENCWVYCPLLQWLQPHLSDRMSFVV